MKAILVDDEPLALDLLEKKINAISDIQIKGKFLSLNLEKEMNVINEIDIVFLDVEMPGINGLELAELLLETNPHITIVFVTAFNQYAVQAFELNALDYILKPVEEDRLEITLDRITSAVKREKELKQIQDEILHVKLCQDLAFLTHTGEVHHVQWRTTKAKEIFLYLLHHQGHTVPKSDLVEIFWSDFEVERAYSQLYTNVYHIRKAITPFESHFSLKSQNEGYLLFVNNTSIDVIEWENRLKQLPSLNEETVSTWEEVMHLYTGHFLEDAELIWAQSERFRLEQIWLKTAFQIANFYRNAPDIENAEKWFLNICSLRPEEEEAHFQLMKIYEELGFGLLINHQYDLLNKAAKELDIHISTHIKDWYNNRNA